MFDVIVCGAGPAGAMASITLSRAGARVLLLDRATFPRDKMCGDTVNPGALSLLRPTGVLEELAGVSAPINGMVVTGENAVRVRCPYRGGEQGLTVLRRDLDLALVRAAAAAGTRVEEGVLVRGPLVDGRDGLRVSGVILAGRDGRDLRVPAPLVIAADGRRSRIAFALGLARHPARPRRWAIGAYYEGVTGLSTFGEMHVRRGWYFGVAPVPGGRANLCLVMPQLRPGGLRAPLALLERITSSDPQLTDRFAQAVRVTRPVVLGPLAVDARSAGLDGLLLAGDAAGFIDPMTGDGLRFALRGGELAAQAAMLHLAGTTRAPHDWLAHARRREFAGKWRFNRGLRRTVSSPFSVRLAALVAAAAPALLDRAVAYAGDLDATANTEWTR